MSLTVLKPIRSEQEKLVEMQLAESVKDAIKAKAVGYLLVYVTADDLLCEANFLPQHVREVIGYIELDVKDTLADLVE